MRAGTASHPSLTSLSFWGLTHWKVSGLISWDFQARPPLTPRDFPGFPGGASGKEPASQYRRLKRLRFEPWVGKIPWRRKWQPTSVLLPGEPHGQSQGSLAGYSPQGCRVAYDRSNLACTHPLKTETSIFQTQKMKRPQRKTRSTP